MGQKMRNGSPINNAPEFLDTYSLFIHYLSLQSCIYTNVSIRTHMLKSIRILNRIGSLYVCVYIYMHVCMYICTHRYACVHVNVCIHIVMCACMHV